MKNPYLKEQAILNGHFRLITEDVEARASQWVKEFGINDASGNVVLNMENSINLDSFEETGNKLKVRFQIFPIGAKQYEVEIDPANQTFIYNGKTIPLNLFKETFKG
ncbi:MAG: hypothetical protein V4565_13600 [Bacteroidota bacterium]